MSTVKALDPQNLTASLDVGGPVAMVPVTPIDILNRAVASGASIEVIERLSAIYERWAASQNRMAWVKATAAAKAEIPAITRNAIGHNNKKYADFSAIAAVVDPILSKHGLYYNFRSHQESNDSLAVTCILSHESGHFEETTMSGPADKTGNKTAIQAIGSTATYLQRYTLVQMLGLAMAKDNDGGEGPISDEQLKQLEAFAREVHANFAAFCKVLGVASLDQLPANKFADAMEKLKLKKSQAAKVQP